MVKEKLTSLSNWPLSLSERVRTDRTYIIPTRFGLYYGISMLLLLAVAFTYANNIVYFICFFLISFGHLSMWITNFNISRLQIEALPTPEFFADEAGKLRIQIENNNEKSSYLLNVRLAKQQESKKIEEVQRKTHQVLEVPLRIHERGWQNVPKIILESSYPFGLLQSWKTKKSDLKVLVYPKREGTVVLPRTGQAENPDSQEVKMSTAKDNDFQGHKPYHVSDSFRRIDWKALARTQHLLVKQFESESQGALQLRWDELNHLEFEKKLNQLSLWIDICEKQNTPYQLVLPDYASPMSCGPKHAKECLIKLALFGAANEK